MILPQDHFFFEVVFLAGAFFLDEALLVAATGSVSLARLDFKRAALLAWMNLVFTALSKTLETSLKVAADGFRRAFLTKSLIRALMRALCSVLFLSLRIFFLALAISGITAWNSNIRIVLKQALWVWTPR